MHLATSAQYISAPVLSCSPAVAFPSHPPAGAELNCLKECDCLRVFNERAIIALVTDDHLCPGLERKEARVPSIGEAQGRNFVALFIEAGNNYQCK